MSKIQKSPLLPGFRQNQKMNPNDEYALNIEALTEILGSVEEAEKQHDDWVRWQLEEDKKFKASQYQRDRREIYPDVREQLDMLWHAIDDGDWTAAKAKTTEFYTKIKKVKDDNPKG